MNCSRESFVTIDGVAQIRHAYELYTGECLHFVAGVCNRLLVDSIVMTEYAEASNLCLRVHFALSCAGAERDERSLVHTELCKCGSETKTFESLVSSCRNQDRCVLHSRHPSASMCGKRTSLAI